jgi:hypothetical protein
MWNDPGMTSGDQETVRAFRRQAQLVRKALAGLNEEAPGRRMVDGYIEIDRWLERYRRLCVPVRRTFLDHDKASFRQSAAVLTRHEEADLRARAQHASGSYEAVMGQLARETVLGGRRIKGTDMVKAWLDAAVFYDSTDRRKPYEEMLGTMGKAVEGLAAEYTEDLARAVLALDEVAAVALDEPLMLPEPEPARPPPREAKRRQWWKRLTGTK